MFPLLSSDNLKVTSVSILLCFKPFVPIAGVVSHPKQSFSGVPGGQSVTLVGTSLVIFGGQDAKDLC